MIYKLYIYYIYLSIFPIGSFCDRITVYDSGFGTVDFELTDTPSNILQRTYRDKFRNMGQEHGKRQISKSTVLSALEGRLKNSSSQQEFMVALDQVHNIAWMRLLSKVNTDDAAGFLTCHGTCYHCLCVCEIFAVSTFVIIIAIFPNIISFQFYSIATTKVLDTASGIPGT